MRFWKKKPLRPVTQINYPSGSVVEVENGWYYIKNTVKIPILKRVFESWNFSNVFYGSEASVKGFKDTLEPLPFREGSLLKNTADGKIYLVSNGQRRHVTNPDWVHGKVIAASQFEINLHQEGAALD